MVQVANNIEQSGSEEFEELLNLHEIYHALNAAASVNNLGDAALLAIQGAIVSLAEEGAPRADIVDIMSQILLFATDDFDMAGIAEILRNFAPIMRVAELTLIQHLAALPEGEFWRVENLETRLLGLGFQLRITSSALEIIDLQTK
jgi:hypothetical protein